LTNKAQPGRTPRGGWAGGGGENNHTGYPQPKKKRPNPAALKPTCPPTSCWGENKSKVSTRLRRSLKPPKPVSPAFLNKAAKANRGQVPKQEPNLALRWGGSRGCKMRHFFRGCIGNSMCLGDTSRTNRSMDKFFEEGFPRPKIPLTVKKVVKGEHGREGKEMGHRVKIGFFEPGVP